MLNTAIVSSPMDIIGVEHGSNAGVQKGQSDGSEFGSMLKSTIKDQQDAKTVESEKPVEQKTETKAEIKPDLKHEAKAETEAKLDVNAEAPTQVKADASHEAKAEAKPEEAVETKEDSKPDSSQAAAVALDIQQATQVAALQLAVAQVADTQVQAPLNTEQVVQQNPASVEQVTQPSGANAEQLSALVANQATAQNSNVTISQESTQTQTAAPVTPDATKATVTTTTEQTASTEEVLVTMPNTKTNTNADTKAEGKVETVMTNSAKPEVEVAKTKSSPSSFFGLMAKGAGPDASAQAKQPEATIDLGYKLYDPIKDAVTDASAKNQTETHSVAHAMAQAAKDGVALEANLGAVLGETQAAPKNAAKQETISTAQVINAVVEEIGPKPGKVESASSSDNAGNQGANMGSQGAEAQSVVVNVPNQTSFDSVIKGVGSTSQPQPTQNPNTEMHTRIIEQLVSEVKLRQVQGQNDLMVKLNPGELGTIRLRITQGDGGLTSQIQASSDHVRNMLQAHLPAITEALSGAGLKVQQVTVSAETAFNSFMQDNNASGTAYQQQNRSRHNSRGQQFGGSQDMVINPAILNAAAGSYGINGSAGYSWLA